MEILGLERVMSSAGVAKLLNLTPCRVRQLSDKGLLPHVRMLNGWRLFDIRDVMAYERARSLGSHNRGKDS